MANSKTRSAALFSAALIIAAGATWYFASPAWTLHAMKSAADANDANTLNTYIDYPALREDLEVEMVGQMRAEAKRDKSGFGGLGLAIGKAVIRPVIDGLVTPTGMRTILTAKRDEARSDPEARAASALHVPDDPVVVRKGFSEFLVATKQQPTSGLVFKRHGLSWKLSGARLPPIK